MVPSCLLKSHWSYRISNQGHDNNRLHYFSRIQTFSASHNLLLLLIRMLILAGWHTYNK